MKKAIQFGAGNIGRGFIGAILSENGYEVCFADINGSIINALNESKEYILEVVGKECKEIKIKNVKGVLSNSDAVYNEILEAELITTAVGPNVLKIIAKTLAEAIKIRKRHETKSFLNIIACENMIEGSTFLKKEILNYLDSDEKVYLEEYIGFPDSAVDRIVPPSSETDDILKVRVEEFNEWIVDKLKFKGEIPKLNGMVLTDNLMAFIERKLFTLNTGHAITAYLGVKAGFSTIKESIENLDIRDIVVNAMKESGEVLINRYGFDRVEHGKYIDKIVARFENPYLVDEVVRVGREPLRKLGYNERLIKPLRGTIEYNLKNENLISGIAAALNYKNENDIQAVELQNKLKNGEFETVFPEITGLDDKSITDRVHSKYLEMRDR